ncbi:MAG: 8-amino-7-oxononanoate synthase [Planctomycetota bacterium]|nr:MAG: 8-amino-7-oxononanoate synthase [Planctomycetota bacterium]
MSGACSAATSQALADLAALERAGLERRLRSVARLDGCRVRVGEREVVSFASCDYLGLARHPELSDAAARAAHELGAGSGSARLLAGHDDSVEALEHELAETFGAPSALVFASGYHANVGLISALAGPGDLILSDRLSHASTVDGCRLSRAEVRVLPHDDVGALEGALRDASNFRRTLVCVEGLYSMDGDGADLARIAPLCESAGALLLVDDAHGLGVLGPGGRGACAAAGVGTSANNVSAAAAVAAPSATDTPTQVAVAAQVGNLGKALGSYGGFALLDTPVRELMLQTARTFVFTCALPPSVIAAARAGLRVLRSETWRVERAQSNARALRDALAERGVPVPASRLPEAPVIPVVLGAAARALDVSAALLERGLFVPAVRPPTVPEGSCRLRISVSADHEPAQLTQLANALAETLAAHPESAETPA